jgi:hypothetical protein
MATIGTQFTVSTPQVWAEKEFVLAADGDISVPIPLFGVDTFTINITGQTADDVIAKVASKTSPNSGDYKTLADGAGANPFIAATANNLYYQESASFSWLTVERDGAADGDITVTVTVTPETR